MAEKLTCPNCGKKHRKYPTDCVLRQLWLLLQTRTSETTLNDDISSSVMNRYLVAGGFTHKRGADKW